MIERSLRPLPEHLYPNDDWGIVETGLTRRWLGHAETIFSLSNGYLGIRGTLDEGRPSIAPATLINGFHETWPIMHAEQAYGFAKTGQTIVNAPDASLIRIYVDDEPLDVASASIFDYRRSLDFREGVLRRSLTWSTLSGVRVRVTSERLVSFPQRHVAAVRYQVETDRDVSLVIVSQLLNRQDLRVAAPGHDREAGHHASAHGRVDSRSNGGVGDQRFPNGTGNGNGAHFGDLDRDAVDPHGSWAEDPHADPRRGRPFRRRVLRHEGFSARGHQVVTCLRTANSGMGLGIGMEHEIATDAPWYAQVTGDPDDSRCAFSIEAKAGQPFGLTKFIAYHTDDQANSHELGERATRSLQRVRRQGFDALVGAQTDWLDQTWSTADVEIEGPDRLQQAVRWNLFQLVQASARADDAGIPAKGLTGLAYEGHYFWDTEIYVAPFLTYTNPRVARNLLRFRYRLLDHARDRATELSERGASFPWRTINGEEASSYYAAGTAQYHINADVAYAIRRHVDVSGDREALAEFGGEVLVETARLWEGLGFFSPTTGRFHIHGVTGPDEYTTVVNDNTFTNLMARRNLACAVEAVEWLREHRPQDYRRLVALTALDDEEVRRWRHAAEAMFVPYDDTRGIHPQDANFLEKEVWDFAATPAEHYPLLLHYHPLVIYRHQVIKQADVVLAMVLLGDEFDPAQKLRNFDYYDPLTTGDSSLSACMQAVLAAEIGNETKAVEYFRYALLMDLADVAGNVVDGVHIASTGGVWMALTYGFAGMTDFGGKLAFRPRLPAEWTRLSFRLQFQHRRLQVELTHDADRFTLLDGDALTIAVHGRDVALEPGTTVDGPRR